MRKTSYVLTFFAVIITLVLNVLSDVRPDWLIVHTPEVLHTKLTITYGLAQRCERQVTRIDGPNHGKFEYSDYECRRFPLKVSDRCEEENQRFCAAWTSVRYFVELGAWSAAASILAIGFGISTHSRRTRIWRVVAGLVFLQAIFQLIGFAIITDLYSKANFPTFESARLGPAYIFNITSWVFAICTFVAVITTGVSADRGHRWAAGNRAYRRIPNA